MCSRCSWRPAAPSRASAAGRQCSAAAGGRQPPSQSQARTCLAAQDLSRLRHAPRVAPRVHRPPGLPAGAAGLTELDKAAAAAEAAAGAGRAEQQGRAGQQLTHRSLSALHQQWAGSSSRGGRKQQQRWQMAENSSALPLLPTHLNWLALPFTRIQWNSCSASTTCCCSPTTCRGGGGGAGAGAGRAQAGGGVGMLAG